VYTCDPFLLNNKISGDVLVAAISGSKGRSSGTSDIAVHNDKWKRIIENVR